MWTLVLKWKCTHGKQECKWPTPCRITHDLQRRSLRSKCHTVPLYQFSWNSHLFDNFFCKTPIRNFMKIWQMGIRCYWVTDGWKWSPYNVFIFLLRKERMTSTTICQNITLVFSRVRESFLKPNLQFRVLLSYTTLHYTTGPSHKHSYTTLHYRSIT